MLSDLFRSFLLTVKQTNQLLNQRDSVITDQELQFVIVQTIEVNESDENLLHVHSFVFHMKKNKKIFCNSFCLQMFIFIYYKSSSWKNRSTHLFCLCWWHEHCVCMFWFHIFSLCSEFKLVLAATAALSGPRGLCVTAGPQSGPWGPLVEPLACDSLSFTEPTELKTTPPLSGNLPELQ